MEIFRSQQLAAKLESEVFAKVRFTWTNPWATLLGWPGETYGTQLLEIELAPEAWIAAYYEGGLTVYDAQGEEVPAETALADPQRIRAIFYQSRADESLDYCGTFSYGGVGFREFILGNISMVKRWSLATPEIAQRLGRRHRGAPRVRGDARVCLGAGSELVVELGLVRVDRAPLHEFPRGLRILAEPSQRALLAEPGEHRVPDSGARGEQAYG